MRCLQCISIIIITSPVYVGASNAYLPFDEITDSNPASVSSHGSAGLEQEMVELALDESLEMGTALQAQQDNIITFNDLPDDALHHLVESFLTPPEIVPLCNTSRRMANIGREALSRYMESFTRHEEGGLIVISSDIQILLRYVEQTRRNQLYFEHEFSNLNIHTLIIDPRMEFRVLEHILYQLSSFNIEVLDFSRFTNPIHRKSPWDYLARVLQRSFSRRRIRIIFHQEIPEHIKGKFRRIADVE